MEALSYLGIIVTGATIFLAAAAHLFHSKDEEMSESLMEGKKTQRLVNEATARYPQASMFNAICFYLDDIQAEIGTLKSNNDISLLTEQLKNLFESRRLLSQERAHLATMEAEMNCDYNLLSSAKI